MSYYESFASVATEGIRLIRREREIESWLRDDEDNFKRFFHKKWYISFIAGSKEAT